MDEINNSSSDVTFLAAEIPEEMKGLRACLRCALIKTYAQFYESGCENCEFLEMQEQDRRLQDVSFIINNIYVYQI